MGDDEARVAVQALLRVIAENGPKVNLEHPEDHGLSQAEAGAISLVMDGLFIGPISHSWSLCLKVPCDCWCRACEQHRRRP